MKAYTPEAFRVLKPGGTFCGCFYVKGENRRTDWYKGAGMKREDISGPIPTRRSGTCSGRPTILTKERGYVKTSVTVSKEGYEPRLPW